MTLALVQFSLVQISKIGTYQIKKVFYLFKGGGKIEVQSAKGLPEFQ